jgi:hypothetical protein
VSALGTSSKKSQPWCLRSVIWDWFELRTTQRNPSQNRMWHLPHLDGVTSASLQNYPENLLMQRQLWQIQRSCKTRFRHSTVVQPHIPWAIGLHLLRTTIRLISSRDHHSTRRTHVLERLVAASGFFTLQLVRYNLFSTNVILPSLHILADHQRTSGAQDQ